MYYLVFIPIYLISLIPLWLLYLIGDGLYVLVYYVFGYRKKVVMGNLAIAFPEKTEAERERIAKDFYHNFINNFLETIKFFSWTYDKMDRRLEADLSGFEEAYATGKTIHMFGMHNFNWEFANWGLAKKLKYLLVGIYMPVGNAAFDKMIFDMRCRYGTVMIPATQFKRHYLRFTNQRHVLASVADQSPGDPSKAFWLNFFGKPTGFVTGPEKGARFQDVAIVFINFFPLRRGRYKIETAFFSANSMELSEGELMQHYVRYIENCIRKNPSSYLWSHRRWKHAWKPEYKSLWRGEGPSPS